MTLGAWLRLGWFAVAADVACWIWELRQPEEQHLSTRHADLNIFLYWGGGFFFVVLLVVSYVVWRVNQDG